MGFGPLYFQFREPKLGQASVSLSRLSNGGGGGVVGVSGCRRRWAVDAEHLQGGAAHQAAGEHAVQRAAERGGRRGVRGGDRGAVAGAAAGRQPPLRALVLAAPRRRRHLLLQVHRWARGQLGLLHRPPQPPPRPPRWGERRVHNC